MTIWECATSGQRKAWWEGFGCARRDPSWGLLNLVLMGPELFQSAWGGYCHALETQRHEPCTKCSDN